METCSAQNMLPASKKSKVATPCEATTLYPIMSAPHKPKNLSKALANLGEGAEGATVDCPETWSDSPLATSHPEQKNCPKGGEDPHTAPS